MSLNLIQYAFVAGEVSPTLYGRTDLEKYDLGLEIARNYIVDYRGGLSTRPGTKFGDFVQFDQLETKFFRFRYAPTISETFVLLFGNNYIRFIQDGAYVLETAKSILSVVVTNPATVNVLAHGFSVGDWVKIAGRTLEVRSVPSVNQFTLNDPFGNAIDAADIPGFATAGTVSRIYTVATTYTSAELATLRLHQHLNEVRITHLNHKPALLTRIDSDNWTLEDVVFETSVESPSNVDANSTANDGYSATFAVSALDANGKESLASFRAKAGQVAFDSSGDSIVIDWTAAPGAVNYNIYRSVLVPDNIFSSGQQVGYIGQSRGLTFTDRNVLPNFALTPPQGFNPFASGAIDYIEITNPGTSYPYDTTVTITDSTPGAGGFVGFPIFRGSTGAIQGVLIINRGKGYAAPTVVFTGSGGSGAAATAELSPASGNNPALFAVVQQRGVYASTENNPITIWGSKPGSFNDFSFSSIVTGDDSYEFTLDAEDVSPIRHLLASRGGLLAMTQSGIWLLTGGADTAISPTNALADPQTYNGVSTVPPIPIGPDILYIEGKGSTVKLLSYNDFSKVYGGISVSILANHLFLGGKKITSWSYAEAPLQLVWGVRSDGALLAFTFVKEQTVYAWTQNWTKGLFTDVISVQEDLRDTTYVMVQRFINGRRTKMFEIMQGRDFTDVDEAWCVDSGLRTEPTQPAANLSFLPGDEITIVATSGIFSASDEGKIFRGGGARGIITDYVNSTTLKMRTITPFTNILPEDELNRPLPLLAGEWSLQGFFSSVSGLWHLEGETVAVFADGAPQGQKTVVGGSITLDRAATQVLVGLPYTCIARNLPPTSRDAIIEDKRKRIVGSAVRIHDTLGLEIGTSLNRLFPMKQRTNEGMGQATRLRRSQNYVAVDSEFDENGQTYYVQRQPLPATILGIVQDFELGDDND